MTRLQKLAGTLCLAFAVAAAPMSGNAAYAHHTQTFDDRYAALVVNAATGDILSSHDADKPVHPASLTKVMTLMLLFDEIEKGTIRLDDEITISAHAAAAVPVKLGYPAGSKIRVEDAIRLVCVKSFNDVAIALAERVGGSENNFAAMMTQKARQLGMSGTTFANATGLPDSRQMTTATDMVRLGMDLINNYRKYYHYFDEESLVYNGAVYHNTNALMKSYPGMDGIKTGYIRDSGFNLLTSVDRNGQRVVAVVFGGLSSKDRDQRVVVLLDDAFTKLKQQQNSAVVARQGSPAPAVKAAPG